MTIDIQDSIISILLADDHSVVRAGIRQFLEQNNRLKVVAEAGDGNTACELLRQHNPDLAMLDIQMPGLNGIDVTRWMRAENILTRVLILSAYDDIPFVQAAVKAGADGYVIKTADPAEIIEAVFRVQRGEKVFSQSIIQSLDENNRAPKDLNKAVLSLREREVLTLTASGLSNKIIAVKLGISDRTVQNHIANIFQALGVASRTEAVIKAIAIGLITNTPGQIGAKK